MTAGPQNMEVPGGPPSEAAAPPPAIDPASEVVELQDLINLGNPTDLSVCLEPLLKALEWRGKPRQMAEALPHFLESVDITSFRNVLASLHFKSHAVETRMDKISLGLIPCLFLPDGRDAMVLLGFEGTHLNVFDSARAIYGAKEGYMPIQPKDWKGTAYVFTPLSDEQLLAEDDGVSWFRALGERFRGLAYQVLGITLVLSLLALAVPLFVMAAFDGAIASGSAETLGYLGAGVGIAVLCDLVLRILRARVFSFVGARLDNIVGVEVFRKIIYLPAALMEQATVGAQVARIKDFERVREFFTGPAAPVLFELPFVPIFIAVVAVLGGPVALVPIAALLLGGGLGLAVMPSIRKSVARAARANAEKQELTVETLGGMRVIKYTGAQTNWLERYRHLSATAALKNLYAAQFSSLMVTLSHMLMVGSGFATVIVGVFRVQGGDMTLGALAASMILVWRAVAPLQTWLVSLARLTQVESGVSHLNSLMRMVAERKARPAAPAAEMIDGKIRFNEVTIRYDPDSPPALHKVDFEVKSGKIVAIVGSNGAGKSTLLKLLAGMYAPDTGKILIDDRDTRTMDVGELRQAIAYVPQTAQFFYGTIAQNMRLAHPTASDQEMHWAARQAGVLADIEALSQGSGKWRRTGFDVRIGERGTGVFSPNLLQRLSLARAYLKRAPVVLLDEPGNGLDAEGDQALIRALANMRGETTVFIVTHRPSHLNMADQIIWLEYGRLKATGQPKTVLQQTAGGIP